ncbi:MAG: hypothetical protein JW922_02435, partial [Paludibacteraceae bacterium]|nr:hypothetical protein [Paludibacteraceae bacterium]
MAFDYGKDTLSIKNPFKTEGLLDIVQGIIVLILGVILVFTIRQSLTEGLKVIAWIELFVSIFFISFGVRTCIIGAIRLFRFLVGRNVPSDISPNPYSQSTIEKVLMNRSNPTFIEKNDFISRLIISIFNRFLFLPIGYRNLVEGVSSILINYTIFLIVFLFSVFSTSIGLIGLSDKNNIITLFGLAFLFQQVFVWIKYRPSNTRITAYRPAIFGYGNIVFTIIISILIPVILELMVRNGIHIPSIDINITLPIILLLILNLIVNVVSFYLSENRLKVLNPETQVSEYKEHLQLALHPKDLFRCFEIEMANKRYKELPNRVYKAIKPILELEGSENKGSFHGSTIQETQPIHKELELPKNAQDVRFYTAVFGRVLILLSAFYLFFKIRSIVDYPSISDLFNLFFYPIVIGLSAYFLIRIAHLFYSEIQFSSFLVHYFADGTYNESQVSTGMSVYDSNRSENTIINTSTTSWILVSEIVSTTFSDSSVRNLE